MCVGRDTASLHMSAYVSIRQHTYMLLVGRATPPYTETDRQTDRQTDRHIHTHTYARYISI